MQGVGQHPEAASDLLTPLTFAECVGFRSHSMIKMDFQDSLPSNRISRNGSPLHHARVISVLQASCGTDIRLVFLSALLSERAGVL